MALVTYRPTRYPQLTQEGAVQTYLTGEFQGIANALQSLTESQTAQDVSIAALQATPANFSAHKNGTDQTISTTAFTKLTFGTEMRDVGGFFDTTNSRWVPPAGLVSINGLVRFLPTNTQANVAYHSALYKNGSITAAGQSLICPSAGSGVLVLGVSFFDVANGTDYYELFAAADSVAAGNLTISGAAVSTYFQGYFVHA